MKCQQCGSELLPGQKKYCSGACCSMAYYIRKNPDRKPQAERWKAEHEQSINKNKRICKQCGKEFVMVRHSKGLFCSYRCRGKYRSEQPRKPKVIKIKPIKETQYRICIICGNSFKVKGKSLVCSIICKNKDSMNKYYANRDAILAAAREKWWKGRDQRDPFQCKECGKVVVPRYETGDSRRTSFCSMRCDNRYNKRVKGNSHVKRARYFGVDCESVDPIKVFIRDGWHCQLCGKKLNRKDRGTIKDNAPELDHIIPLSKGGEHSYRNTQCACRKCNIDKSNNVIGQTRLFG